jgi:hypothetical protein
VGAFPFLSWYGEFGIPPGLFPFLVKGVPVPSVRRWGDSVKGGLAGNAGEASENKPWVFGWKVGKAGNESWVDLDGRCARWLLNGRRRAYDDRYEPIL